MAQAAAPPGFDESPAVPQHAGIGSGSWAHTPGEQQLPHCGWGPGVAALAHGGADGIATVKLCDVAKDEASQSDDAASPDALEDGDDTQAPRRKPTRRAGRRARRRRCHAQEAAARAAIANEAAGVVTAGAVVARS